MQKSAGIKREGIGKPRAAQSPGEAAGGAPAVGRAGPPTAGAPLRTPARPAAGVPPVLTPGWGRKRVRIGMGGWTYGSCRRHRPARFSPAQPGSAPQKVGFGRAGCTSKGGRAVGGEIKGAATAHSYREGIYWACWCGPGCCHPLPAPGDGGVQPGWARFSAFAANKGLNAHGNWGWKEKRKQLSPGKGFGGDVALPHTAGTSA